MNIYKFTLISISFLILSLVPFTYGQKTTFNKALRKKLDEANYYYHFENFHLALPVYMELYKADSLNTEVNYKIGVCIYNTNRDKAKAIMYFEEAMYGIDEEWNVGKEYIDTYYYLGRLSHLQLFFYKAVSYFQFYKYWAGEKNFTNEQIDYYIDKANVARQFMANPVDVNIQNIGDIINSPYPDYVPLISSDESVLIFTSRREGSTGGFYDPVGEFYEDIYISHKVDGQWAPPENMGEPINTDFHDACVSLSADGQQLFIYKTNKELTGGDIYVSKFIDGKWNNPEKLSSEVNSKNGLETSVSLSPDESTLYFSSSRKGGYGGKDIYRIKKIPNGEWSLALNLGPAINTAYDEDAPFIHPDGKTLYFCSKGHKNMGGYDIFLSRQRFKTLLDEETNIWSTPENLGYPINTVNDDIFFVVTADGKRGYYSSNRQESVGYSDLYTIDMFGESYYMLLKGKVLTLLPNLPAGEGGQTGDSLMPLNATITLIDIQTKKLQGIYRTNKKTGKYVLVVTPKRKYKIIVEAKGFHNYIDEIEILESEQEQYILKDILLNKKNE